MMERESRAFVGIRFDACRRRLGFVGLALTIAGSAFGGESQAVSVAPKAFAQNPAQYLNQKIAVRDFACYRRESDYLCSSGKGLDVVAGVMEASAAKKKIDEECGEMDGIERTPGCVVDLSLTPASVAREQGNVVRKGRAATEEIWVVHATSISITARH
jgi:hypothetical protein